MKLIICDMSGIASTKGINNDKLLNTLGSLKNYNCTFCTGKGYQGGYETLKKIDQKATSLYVLKNKSFDVEMILRKILDLFFERYDKFVSKGFINIKDEYEARCNFIGNKITIRETGVQYTAISINKEGLLIVKDENGKEFEIMTGDILC